MGFYELSSSGSVCGSGWHLHHNVPETCLNSIQKICLESAWPLKAEGKHTPEGRETPKLVSIN